MKTIAILGDTIVNDKHYGIQRFAFEILKELDKIIDKNKVILVVKKNQNIDKVKFKNISIIKTGVFKNNFLWRQVCFTRFVKKHKFLAMDMTLGLPFFKCDIVCLHDCIYEKFDADFKSIKSKIKRLFYLIKVKHIQKNAKRIITVSETSKKELMNYYGICEEKISVIYNAWQHMNYVVDDTYIIKKLGLENKKFAFTLGSVLPHKNLKWIIENAKYNDITYIISGDLSMYNSIKTKEICIPKNVIFSGYLSDGEIKALMKYCYIFIQPSLIEGFGIPPLEAMSQNANVLLSDIPCFREIYGNNANYFNPFDYSYNIKNFFKIKPNYENILSKYSWQKSSLKLLNILEKVE